MHWIGRRGDEIEFLVEAAGLLILRMHREGPDAGDVGRLDGALHGVPQERLPDSLPLPTAIHRQARKQHDRQWMARQPLGEALRRFLASDLADGERMIADDGIFHQPDISLGRSGLLVRPSVSQQIPVEFLPAAVKAFRVMIGAELFYTARRIH